MRVRAVSKPFHRGGSSTWRVEGTGPFASRRDYLAAGGIFLANAAATLTISVPDPLVSWGYALAVLTGACWWTFCSARSLHAKTAVSALASVAGLRPSLVLWRETALLAIAAWGALQWISGRTVFRYATLDAWTHAVALMAVALVARGALANERLRYRFLETFVWFATAVSGAGVLAYFTSPGRILWLFPSPYPDTWGPFLSRNDFAAFLELALPVALWLGLGNRRSESIPNFSSSAPSPHQNQRDAGRKDAGRSLRDRPGRDRPRRAAYLCIAAWLLAAGVASASRAGSALLAAEAIVIVAWRAPRASAVRFAGAALVLIAIVGAGTLAGRWHEPDAWRYRREIDRSALSMIAARPLGGFGLGTFARVYPAYACFDPGAVVEHAHDDWLEWASEGGLFYALAWFVMAISVARPAARSLWGIGVIAIFLHALVDYPFAKFGVSAWTMALIGALGADEMREVPVRAH